MNHTLFGEEGITTARTAIEAMAERLITPTPENYAVWLCYLTQANAELTLAINALIKAERPIDDRDRDRLIGGDLTSAEPQHAEC